MSQTAHAIAAEYVEDEDFFAPVDTDRIDALISQYEIEKGRIEAVTRFMDEPAMRESLRYFITGCEREQGRHIPDPKALFDQDAALAALNAAYWARTLEMTDVLDYMPDARRRAWHKQIHSLSTPAFDENTVRATLQNLLASRMDFFSEMVEGIFVGLSREHVTNRPEGFSTRMIINYVYDPILGAAIGEKAGLIHDLRFVLARLMGRDNPSELLTRRALDDLRKTPGTWRAFDGHALRMRGYKKGTLHLEVHPDIAWRLNAILAHRNPQAIPHAARRKPTREQRLKRAIKLMDCPIPFTVLQRIENARINQDAPGIWTLPLFMRGDDKHLRRSVEETLSALGGVHAGIGFQFDYNPEPVLKELARFGALPDRRSHQYYPTPERLAERAVELAEIGPEHECLEPSAGQGAIARLMPADRTHCIEVSALHARILTERGLSSVEQGDFLRHTGQYDRIVMNPPFDQGRALLHVEHAMRCLKPGGRLVALLPAGLQSRDLLPDYEVRWAERWDNAFEHASVSVAAMVVDKPA